MAKPVEIEIIMKDRLSGGLDKAGRKVDELKGKTASANAELDKQAQKLRDSIALLETQMEELRRAGQNASPNLDQRENIAGIEVLQKQIAELEAQLKHLDATAESTQTIPPELPAARQQFNGLHMSIQQMAREMPSLAMGPQMFFLAISNNLPIFADEVQRAKREYEGLVKAGQKGVPVWRQILSSLFSWQTALTTGIMLLVMYGDEIVDWVKGLFSAKEGVDALKKSLQEKNEVEKEGHAVSVRTRSELDNTISELRDFVGTKEQEKSKVDELNRKYGDAFGSYKTLAEWYDVLIQKGNAYIESLFNQAKAQSYIKKAVEADEKANEIRSKGKEEYRPFWGPGGKAYMFFGGSNIGHYGSDPAETAFNKALQEVENEKQHYLNQAEWFQQEYSRIIKESGLSDYRPITPEAPADNSTKNQAENRKQAQQRLNDELLALERQNQDEELDLMDEGTAKRLAQIDAEKAEVEKMYIAAIREVTARRMHSAEYAIFQGEVEKADSLVNRTEELLTKYDMRNDSVIVTIMNGYLRAIDKKVCMKKQEEINVMVYNIIDCIRKNDFFLAEDYINRAMQIKGSSECRLDKSRLRALKRQIEQPLEYVRTKDRVMERLYEKDTMGFLKDYADLEQFYVVHNLKEVSVQHQPIRSLLYGFGDDNLAIRTIEQCMKYRQYEQSVEALAALKDFGYKARHTKKIQRKIGEMLGLENSKHSDKTNQYNRITDKYGNDKWFKYLIKSYRKSFEKWKRDNR